MNYYAIIDKIDILPQETIMQLCSDHHNEETIFTAKCVLYDLCENDSTDKLMSYKCSPHC